MTPEELRAFLADSSGRAVELAVTRNRTRFVSFRTDALGRVKARVQEAFLDAPDRALAALARWIARGAGRCPGPVREFIRTASVPLARERPLRAVAVRTAGRVHDLAAVYERVNREFIGSAVQAPITWGRACGRKVRHRRLGSWNPRRRLLSVNPVLDRPEVPEFFVEFIVYHEMLHTLQPADCRRRHGREFHLAEKRHPDYRAAREWEKKNLSLILRRS